MAPIDSSIRGIAEKVRSGERLAFEDGVRLYRSPDIQGIGALANAVRERRHGGAAYWVANCHVNYSNVCAVECMFCAFGRKKGDPLAYEMDVDEIVRRAETAWKAGATEVHMVGGLHPDLPYDWYLRMLRAVRERAPGLHLKAFTAVEVQFFARISGRSVREVLQDLIDAGLGSLPGGGAEIFAERVRRKVCPDKATAEEWLEIHRTAHRLGLKSTATMLYGHIESDEDRVDHMLRLRSLQDETGGFTTFIPLAFHPDNTALRKLPPPSGLSDLRQIAVSRLLLDNFDHVKVFWIMTGLDIAQIALWYGADDIDGTVVDERITHMAGAETPVGLTEDALCRIIREAGRRPVKRDTVYEKFQEAAPA